MNELKIVIDLEPAFEDQRTVFEGLYRFNAEQTKDNLWQNLGIFLRDDQGLVCGGLLGKTYWGWLHIEFFWLDATFRQQGYGKEILRAAENEAIARGCRAAVLDTFSFQAYEFYKRQGYEEFGALDNFPGEHKRHYLKKELVGIERKTHQILS